MSDRMPAEEAEALATLVYKDLKDHAHRLVERFSPSRSFTTVDLLDEAILRVLKVKGPAPAFPGPDQARAYVYRVMKHLMVDHARRERPTTLGDQDPAGGQAHGDLRIDLLTLFRKLDRTEEPHLRKAFAAYKAYHFSDHRSRFSKEGDQLLSELHLPDRTYREVGTLLGIPTATVAFRVNYIRRWLADRLQDCREEMRR